MSETKSNVLFLSKQKGHQVIFTLLREATSVEDLQPFLASILEVCKSDGQKLSLFVDCNAIKLNPININLKVLKAIYNFLTEHTALFTSRVHVCCVLTSSGILASTVTSLLNSTDFNKNNQVHFSIFSEKSQCLQYLQSHRTR